MKKQNNPGNGKYWAIGTQKSKWISGARNHIGFLCIVAVIVLLILWMFGTYNSLVSLQEGVHNTWADVETQYQRRADLIPNLVETVKGYATHEKTLFEDVAKMRSAWTSAKDSGNLDQEMVAARGLDGALGRLLAVAENYPDLKANQNFLALQDQLEGTENRVAVARTRYNEAVRDYNMKTKRVPGNLITNWFGFMEEKYFEAQEGSEEVPFVKFT